MSDGTDFVFKEQFWTERAEHVRIRKGSLLSVNTCAKCGWSWPCPTIRDWDAAARGDGEQA